MTTIESDASPGPSRDLWFLLSRVNAILFPILATLLIGWGTFITRNVMEIREWKAATSSNRYTSTDAMTDQRLLDTKLAQIRVEVATLERDLRSDIAGIPALASQVRTLEATQNESLKALAAIALDVGIIKSKLTPQ